MLIQLIRNQPKANALTGRLIINGRWFCNTLERVGYQIPALCYHIAVTQSHKFKRLLPLVQNVPRTGDKAKGDKAMRQGIRFHVGTKSQHSTGCILVPDREIEELLTSTLLEAQNNHEEIILEVTDFTPGTQYGYDHPCPPELQKP